MTKQVRIVISIFSEMEKANQLPASNACWRARALNATSYVDLLINNKMWEFKVKNHMIVFKIIVTNANKIAATHVSAVCENTLGKAMYFKLWTKFFQRFNILHCYTRMQTQKALTCLLFILHHYITTYTVYLKEKEDWWCWEVSERYRKGRNCFLHILLSTHE